MLCAGSLVNRDDFLTELEDNCLKITTEVQ